MKFFLEFISTAETVGVKIKYLSNAGLLSHQNYFH